MERNNRCSLYIKDAVDHVLDLRSAREVLLQGEEAMHVFCGYIESV